MLLILLVLFLIVAAIILACKCHRRSPYHPHIYRINGGIEIDMSLLKDINVPEFDVPEIEVPTYLDH